MIFKSKQVNTDPKPYEYGGMRYPEEGLPAVDFGEIPVFDPRPEYNVTRDKFPWLDPEMNQRYSLANENPEEPYESETGGTYNAGSYVEWEPRPEFDHPVNRILAGVRDDMAGSTDLNGDAKATAEYWLSFSDDWDKDGLTATPDEIDHARRVLERLARWSA